MCLLVGVCSVRRSQHFLGLAMDLPAFFWTLPTLVGSLGPCTLETPPVSSVSPLKLPRSMCVACVLALPGWTVLSLLKEVHRGPVYVYVDAARDAGVYRLGLFSLALGSRSVIPSGQRLNQQCVEALLWGIKFI